MHHRDLAGIWTEIDRDPEVRAVRGAGDAFSARGDLDLVADMADDFEVRLRVLREARRSPACSAAPSRWSRPWPARPSGPSWSSACSPTSRSPPARPGSSTATRLGLAAGDHAAIVWPLLKAWPRPSTTCCCASRCPGEEAERIGLVSRCVDDADLHDVALEVAVRLAGGSQSAIRWTKYALNNWLRLAGPTPTPPWRWSSSASPARTCARGGVVRERRPPHFSGSA